MPDVTTGGRLACRTLKSLGASTIFSVSGNQVMPIFDAAADEGLRIVHMRHESAAAFAAAGAAEMTQNPGVVLTSAGPAFLAALTGVSVVRMMELPLVFLSGDSPVTNSGFGNFQEMDQAAAAQSACKASLRVSKAAEIRNVLTSAWETAVSGVPGPVHVSLPADTLTDKLQAPAEPPPQRAPIALPAAALKDVADRLLRAERPMVIARPSAARGQTGLILERLAHRLGVRPLVTGPPRGLADPKYVHLTGLYKQSDCAVVLAPSDYALGFLSESVIASDGAVLLIDDPGDPKPRRRPDIHVQCGTAAALEFLLGATAAYSVRDTQWSRRWLAPPARPERPEPDDGPLHPLEVAFRIREALQTDDILVVDGGEFCQWIRLGLHDVPNRWLWNSKFGVIGNSIPMAVGVGATRPPGRIVAIMGDGGCAYHLAEFETAARYGIPFVAIIGNDARWGAEWHLQAARYGPDRTFETCLLPARYDVAAEGFGGVGFSASTSTQLESALAAAMALRKPACINVSIQSLRSPAVPP